MTTVKNSPTRMKALFQKAQRTDSEKGAKISSKELEAAIAADSRIRSDGFVQMSPKGYAQLKQVAASGALAPEAKRLALINLHNYGAPEFKFQVYLPKTIAALEEKRFQELPAEVVAKGLKDLMENDLSLLGALTIVRRAELVEALMSQPKVPTHELLELAIEGQPLTGKPRTAE